MGSSAGTYSIDTVVIKGHRLILEERERCLHDDSPSSWWYKKFAPAAKAQAFLDQVSSDGTKGIVGRGLSVDEVVKVARLLLSV